MALLPGTGWSHRQCPAKGPKMDTEPAQRQLGLIADTVAMSERLGAQIWLRGGWAMDFFLGHVTRDHVDIDWEAWIGDAPAITAALHADGYQTIPGPPPDQQLAVAKGGLEMSFGWLARDRWPLCRRAVARRHAGLAARADRTRSVSDHQSARPDREQGNDAHLGGLHTNPRALELPGAACADSEDGVGRRRDGQARHPLLSQTQLPLAVSRVTARCAAARTRGTGSARNPATASMPSPTRFLAMTLAAISLTRQCSSAVAPMIAVDARSSQTCSRPRAAHTRGQ